MLVVLGDNEALLNLVTNMREDFSAVRISWASAHRGLTRIRRMFVIKGEHFLIYHGAGDG